MTEEQLAALERLARAATPGEWQTGGCGRNRWIAAGDEWIAHFSTAGSPAAADADAAYIAAAQPRAMLRLIAAARAPSLREALASAHEQQVRAEEERDRLRDLLWDAEAVLRRALPHLVEASETLVRCGSTSYEWKSGMPIPEDCEAEAACTALDVEAVIADARAVLAAIEEPGA